VNVKENQMIDGLLIKDIDFEEGKLTSVVWRPFRNQKFQRLFKDENLIEHRTFHLRGKLKDIGLESSVVYDQGGLLISNAWYINGQKRFERKRGGNTFAWLPNGDECPITNLKEGNGILVEYDYYNGKERYRSVYENDKLKSRFTTSWYYKTDQKRSTHEYADSSNKLIISIESWKPNGDKCPITNFKDGNGVLVIYNSDGTEYSRITYKKGKIAKD
jgi:hypothetical protein